MKTIYALTVIIALATLAPILTGCLHDKKTVIEEFTDGKLVKKTTITEPVYNLQYYTVGTGLKIGIDPETRIPVIWFGYLSCVTQYIISGDDGNVSRVYKDFNIWQLTGNIDVDLSVGPTKANAEKLKKRTKKSTKEKLP